MTALAGSALRAPVGIRSAEECAVAGRLPWIEETGKVAPMDARVLSKEFFVRLRVLEEGTPEYQYARNTLIELNVSVVKFAAARFRHRREGMEELIQVGMIGLIKAIDRFDLSREVEFTTFAIPYISGRSSGSCVTRAGRCTYPVICRSGAWRWPRPRRRCRRPRTTCRRRRSWRPTWI